MKVIILKTKEVKNVAEGYARNYLLPNKLAVIATPELEKKALEEQKNLEKNQKQNKEENIKKIKALENKTVEINVKDNEEGGLFATLKESEIADAIKKQLKVDLDPKNIKFSEPIKKIGKFAINIEFDSKNKTLLTVQLNKI